MTDLIAKLEAATGPDRELDTAIATAIDWHERGTSIQEFCKKHPEANVSHWGFPRYTRSVDAALELVPEGWIWAIQKNDAKDIFGPGAFQSFVQEDAFDLDSSHHAEAPTPALALLTAIMKAREAG